LVARKNYEELSKIKNEGYENLLKNLEIVILKDESTELIVKFRNIKTRLSKFVSKVTGEVTCLGFYAGMSDIYDIDNETVVAKFNEYTWDYSEFKYSPQPQYLRDAYSWA